MRVLVVDDHPAFRRASSALRMVKGIEVAGEAGGGGKRPIALKDDPDLVLMDLSMPDFDGIEAMRRIHEDRPELPVVILSARRPRRGEGGQEAGASGFLAKGTAGSVIVLHECPRALPRHGGSTGQPGLGLGLPIVRGLAAGDTSGRRTPREAVPCSESRCRARRPASKRSSRPGLASPGPEVGAAGTG